MLLDRLKGIEIYHHDYLKIKHPFREMEKRKEQYKQ